MPALTCVLLLVAVVPPPSAYALSKDIDYAYLLKTYVTDLNSAYDTFPIRGSDSPVMDDDSTVIQQASSLFDSFAGYNISILDVNATARLISGTINDDGTVTVTAYRTDSVTWTVPGGVDSQFAQDGKMSSDFGDIHEIIFATADLTRDHGPEVLQDTIVEPIESLATHSTDQMFPLDRNQLPKAIKPQTLSYATKEEAEQSIYQTSYKANRLNTRSQKLTMYYDAFINYANKWTAPPYNGDDDNDFNPAFPRYSNNCTNFGSQVLYAAGLPKVKGILGEKDNTRIWTWNLDNVPSVPGHPEYDTSLSWNNADANYLHLIGYTPYSKPFYNMYQAPQGGLIYTEWTGDAYKDHMMIVNDVIVIRKDDGTWTPMPLISQKTSNRNKVMFYVQETRAYQQHSHVDWYGLGPDYESMTYM